LDEYQVLELQVIHPYNQITEAAFPAAFFMDVKNMERRRTHRIVEFTAFIVYQCNGD
jgi:hypothetical protein